MVRSTLSCGVLSVMCTHTDEERLGQEAFISFVDSIPTSLLRASYSSESRSPSPIDEIEEDQEQHTRKYRALFASRLNFLARYREFFALYARGDRRKAAELLVLMLTSRVAPKGFWTVSPSHDCC